MSIQYIGFHHLCHFPTLNILLCKFNKLKHWSVSREVVILCFLLSPSIIFVTTKSRIRHFPTIPTVGKSRKKSEKVGKSRKMSENVGKLKIHYYSYSLQIISDIILYYITPLASPNNLNLEIVITIFINISNLARFSKFSCPFSLTGWKIQIFFALQLS